MTRNSDINNDLIVFLLEYVPERRKVVVSWSNERNAFSTY